MPAAQNEQMRAACTCGTCSIYVGQIPKARLRCHCTICQEFTGSPFSDVAILPAGRARFVNKASIDFRMYKQFRFPPPNLSRGRCHVCGQPFVETWGSGALKLLFLREPTLDKPKLLPPIGAHIFYEHRIADAHDDVPKHEGYLASQLALGRLIAAAF